MQQRYFGIEILVTYCMFLFAGILLANELTGSLLYFLIAMAAGFLFSWHAKARSFPYFSLVVGFGVAAVIIWSLVELYNSDFGYQETLITEMRGVFLLSAIFSFGSFKEKFLSFLQILSLMLVMCSPIFIKAYDLSQYLAIFCYISCWVLFLKLKFCQKFQMPVEREMLKDYHPFIVVIAGLLVTVFFFLGFSGKQEIGGGLFYAKDHPPLLSDLEKKYSQLQDKVLRMVPDSLIKTGYNQDISSAPLFLNNLVKDPGLIKEVARAEVGLVSLLRNAGLGIEENQDKEMMELIKEFVDTKAELNFQKIKKDIQRKLREGLLFNIKQRYSAQGAMNKMENSKSVEEVKGEARKLNKIIGDSNFGPEQETQLKKMAEELKLWRIFRLHREEVYLSAKEELRYPEAVSESQAKQEEAQVPKAVPPENITPPPQPPQPETPPVLPPRKPIFNLTIILLLFFFLLSVLLVILMILYIMTEQRKSRILSLYEANSAAFIISLYLNMKDILAILGARCKNTVTPLKFAGVVEDKYHLKESPFSRFSLKFEEAKYSQHPFEKKDSQAVLQEYNNIIKDIFNSQGVLSVFYAYCTALVRRKPIFI
ncbi:MAG: hypothetical protein ABSB18_04975 [Candidatus Omnitrophota bacterium]